MRLSAFTDELVAASIELLEQTGRRRTYPAHSILFFEEDEATTVMMVRAGSVKLSIVMDDREVMLDVLGPGDLIGELAAIEGRPRSATATAMSMVEVISIPASAFMSAVATRPDIARALLRSMAARLRNASRRQVEYGALDAAGRVCRRLVELGERFGSPVSAGLLIDAPFTQSDIAAWAGLSREAVVKALHSLRSFGWIDTSGRSIIVADLSALRARASLCRAGS